MITDLERSLVEKARNGDRTSFDELFLNHQNYLFNLMYQLSGDIAGADDLSREAMIRAYRKIHLFRCESSFRTWLSRIAINLFRKEGRAKILHEPLDFDRIQIPDQRNHLDRIVMKSELQRCIVHNLHHHVPPKYRIVLIPRDLQDMSYKEIADIMGYNIGRVKTNLHRARHIFREQFIDGRCRAFAEDYLCICEGILEL